MPVKIIIAAGLPELEKKINEAIKADPTLEFHSLSHRQLAAVLVTKPRAAGLVSSEAKPKRPTKGSGKRG